MKQTHHIKTPKRIALLMDHGFAYNRLALRGIYEHVVGQANWTVHQANPEPRNLPALREWAPDGVIGHISGAVVGNIARRPCCLGGAGCQHHERAGT